MGEKKENSLKGKLSVSNIKISQLKTPNEVVVSFNSTREARGALNYYMGKAGLPIPTRISQLENDLGFITKENDELVYYYTKEEVDALIEESGKLEII